MERLPDKPLELDEESRRILGSIGLIDATEFDGVNPNHEDNVWLSNN